VKPHLGILVPFILAAKRKWHAIFSTMAISAVFILISVMLFGIESWQTWISSTLPFQSSLIGLPNENMGYLRMMPTGERLATSLGLSGMAAAALQFSLAFGAIGLLAHAWRRGVDFADLGLLSIIAVFLILPYVFNYDMVGFNLALLVLSARIAPTLKPVEQIILGAAFLIPVVQMALAQIHLQIAPLLILASLAILSRRLPAQ
jgi:Glycosyltransferase family 87